MPIPLQGTKKDKVNVKKKKTPDKPLNRSSLRVHKGEGSVILIWHNLDVQFLATVQLGGISKRLVTDLVQGIGSIGDELTKENLLVRIESVDDEAHQLGNLSLEGESLGLGFHLNFFGHLDDFDF